MIGDIMGDNFTKQDFWNKLADQDRSLFTKIADTIKAWLEQFIKSNNLGSDAVVKDIKMSNNLLNQQKLSFIKFGTALLMIIINLIALK